MEPLPFLRWFELAPVPDPEGFAAPFAGVSNGTLLVAGGANFPGARPWEGGTKVWYDTVFALEAPDADRWTTPGRLPRPLAYGVSVTTRDGVVCAGGGDAHEHFADVFLLRQRRGALERHPLPSLPRPCAFMSGALANDRLYVAGGIERPDATSPLATFWSLDLADAQPRWAELPWPNATPRMLAVAAAVGRTFYLFSGVGLHAGADGRPVRTYLRDAHAYDPDQGWRRLADLPRAAVAAPSPAPVDGNGRPLVIGGDDGTRVALNGPAHPGFCREVLAYSPVEDAWSEVGAVPFSSATVPTAPWHGHWIIANGERIPGIRTPRVWRLTTSR